MIITVSAYLVQLELNVKGKIVRARVLVAHVLPANIQFLVGAVRLVMINISAIILTCLRKRVL